MTNAFICIGFGCLTAVTLTAAFWLTVYLVDAAVRKTSLIRFVARCMIGFYSSVPKQYDGYAGCVVTFDFETRKFGRPVYVKDNGMTDDEYAVYVADMKARWTHKTEV